MQNPFRRFLKFPIVVKIIRKNQNATIIDDDKGAFVTKKKKTATGLVTERYIDLYNENVKIPDPGTRFYIKNKGKNCLYFLQLDRENYQPISTNEKGLFYQATIYQTDEKGKVMLDAEKKPIITGTEDKQLFNNQYILENGKVVHIPELIGVKTHDPEAWRQRRNDIAERLFKSNDFFSKHAGLIQIIVVGVTIAIIMSVAMTKLNESTKIAAESNMKSAAAQQSIAEGLDKVTERLERIAGGNPSPRQTSVPPPS